MDVKVIWVTPNAESLIAHIARVSNPANQDNPNYEGLIKYLIKNNHWSPFEMVNVCFEIKTSRALSAQLCRHRSFSFQEFSQRYAAVPDIEPVELRAQAAKNRQSSEELCNPMIDDSTFQHDKPHITIPIQAHASDVIASVLQIVNNTYNSLIDAGVAKECARMILPMASSTTLYMNGTLRSWLTYLNLRLEDHAQKEHRQIAYEIAKILALYFPITTEALNSFNDFKGSFI